MRILYLHQYFVTPEMSGGTRSYEMARRFAAQGHEVHMVTSYRKPTTHTTWFETEEAGIRVHWLPVPYSNAMSYAERIRAFIHFALAAPRRAVVVGGDVVFATSTPLTIAIPGVYAAKRLRVPMVFEVRDLWPELPIAVGALNNPVLQWAARRLEHFAYRNAAQVVALSPGMRDGVVRTGYPAERVHVIPNSSDIERFRAADVDAERFLSQYPHLRGKKLVVYAGTLGIINGVGYLARLAATMRGLDPEVHIVIVGDGREKSDVRAEAEALGVLGQNLDLLPPVPKEDMPDVLAAATVATSLFVDLPTMWHNSANKFFDALAAGKPVAINYGGWQASLLRTHGAGLVLPTQDPSAGAEVLAAFLHDVDRLDAARRAASTLAETHFDRDDLARQLLEVLEKAAFDGLNMECYEA